MQIIKQWHHEHEHYKKARKKSDQIFHGNNWLDMKSRKCKDKTRVEQDDHAVEDDFQLIHKVVIFQFIQITSASEDR